MLNYRGMRDHVTSFRLFGSSAQMKGPSDN
jgi:hypothetical protein